MPEQIGPARQVPAFEAARPGDLAAENSGRIGRRLPPGVGKGFMLGWGEPDAHDRKTPDQSAQRVALSEVRQRG